MKHLFFGALVLALAPVASFAQPKPSTPQVVGNSAAKKLLDDVTARYQAAKGVKFSLALNENKAASSYNVSFQRPNLLRVEKSDKGGKSLILADGKSLYTTQEDTYKRTGMPTSSSGLWLINVPGGTGYMMSAMFEGRSPLMVIQDLIKNAPFPSPTIAVSVPPASIVDGISLHGVKFLIASAPAGKPAFPQLEIYTWLDSDGLLRRVSTRDLSAKREFQSTEQLSDQQLDPTFASDTFKFDSTGLKLAQEKPAPKEEQYFDARLKVGAAPFVFTAKDLKGATITPANYKGKVLLMDFWATWCGPCVASLPELKGAYDKYHSKGLEVVGISLDEDKKALTSFIAARKMPWPQVFDGKGWGSTVPGVYGVRAIPFMLVIGKDGKIAAVNPRGDIDTAVKAALAAK